MKKSIAFLALCALAVPALADGLPADEQAFITQHTSDVITVTPKRLSDSAMTKVFGVPLYDLSISISAGDGGTSGQEQIVGRLDDKLVAIARPSTDQDCPNILKMLSPTLTLQSDDDARAVQSALDQVFPVTMDDDKKAVAFRHAGHDWTFIRGKFMDNKLLGFVLSTDDAGKVTAVKFSLNILV